MNLTTFSYRAAVSHSGLGSKSTARDSLAKQQLKFSLSTLAKASSDSFHRDFAWSAGCPLSGHRTYFCLPTSPSPFLELPPSSLNKRRLSLTVFLPNLSFEAFLSSFFVASSARPSGLS